VLVERGLLSYVRRHVTRITVAIGVIGLGLAGASYSAATTEITQMGQVIPATDEGDNQRAVAISGNGKRIIVGGFSFGRGSARVFEWDASQWVQVGSTIVGATAFGSAVAISANGNRIAVSAADGGDAGNGRVFIYHWSGSAWTQLGATINRTEDLDMEGTSLAMSADGNHLIIGSPGAKETDLQVYGAVTMWGWDGNAWTEEAHFEGSKPSGISVRFGTTVAISANGEVAVAATGSTQSSPISSGNEGNAQVFRRQNNGTWTAAVNDNITGVINSLQVVGAVSLSGDGTVLALSYGRQYRLQILQYNGSNWVNRGDHFYPLYHDVASLSLDGNRIMVTQPWINDEKGITRAYDWDGSQWIQLGGDIADSVGSALGHAGAMSLDGSRFVVSPYYKSSQTRVYQIMSPEPEPDPEPETPTNNNETVVVAPTSTIVSNPDSSVTQTQSATTTRVRDLPATGSSTHTMLWLFLFATGVALTVISRRQKLPPC
jgi:hypothetical protein